MYVRACAFYCDLQAFRSLAFRGKESNIRCPKGPVITAVYAVCMTLYRRYNSPF